MKQSESIAVGITQSEIEKEYTKAQRNERWLSKVAKLAPCITFTAAAIEIARGDKRSLAGVLYAGVLTTGGAMLLRKEEQGIIADCNGAVSCYPNGIDLSPDAIPDFDFVPRAFLD